MGRKDRFYVDIMAVHPEVTGSCIMVSVHYPDNERTNFIVDCGLFQEREYSKYNSELPFNPANIEFCLITHNHVDHIGKLPYLAKNGFFGKVYMTHAGQKLAPLALKDSCKVLRDLAKRKCENALYREEDVSKAISLTEGCDYGQPIRIGQNIKVTFFKNGHLIGAAMILVQISYYGNNDINLLFTGDYNNKNVFLDLETLPELVKEMPLTLIQEATYGDMESTGVVKCFQKNLMEAINNDGSVVVPVFSLGRSQEILYDLRRMQEDGILDEEIPIYFDGKLTHRYTELYLNSDLGLKEGMQDFLPTNVTFVDKTTRNPVIHGEERKIIVTTSGMGTYGPAQTYIQEYLTRENALIHFTGYTAEGTLGRKLKDTPPNGAVEIGGVVVCKRADVEYTTEYSAHAKADEMIDFLKAFKNLKLVLVNHGEEGVKDKFAERIMEQVKPKRIGILGRSYFFRVNPYGLVKTKPTKFM